MAGDARRTGAPAIERLLLACLGAVLVWAPLPFGSNRPWAQALLAALLLAVGALTLLCTLWRAGPGLETLRGLRWPLALLCLWCLWLALQLVPLPPELVRAASPRAWELQLPVHAPGEWMPLSLDRGRTLLCALVFAACAATVMSVVLLVHTRRRLAALALVLVGLGAVEALLGLAVYWQGLSTTLAEVAGQHRLGPTGSFVNRNHFAGFLELALGLGIGIAAAALGGDARGRGWRAAAAALAGALLGPRALFALVQILMAAALVLSASRAGVAALLVGVLVGGISIARTRRRRALRALAPSAVAVAVALLWFGLGGLGERLSAHGLSSNRAELRQVSHAIADDFPLTGSGAGTFAWVFAAYKDERFGGLFYEHAHNDYLQVLVEHGVVGLALMILVIGLLLRACYCAHRDRRDPLARGVALGALIGGVALTVHSLFDFNLQIPSNLIWFFTLLGLGACAGKVQQRR